MFACLRVCYPSEKPQAQGRPSGKPQQWLHHAGPNRNTHAHCLQTLQCLHTRTEIDTVIMLMISTPAWWLNLYSIFYWFVSTGRCSSELWTNERQWKQRWLCRERYATPDLPATYLHIYAKRERQANPKTKTWWPDYAYIYHMSFNIFHLVTTSSFNHTVFTKHLHSHPNTSVLMISYMNKSNGISNIFCGWRSSSFFYYYYKLMY